MAGRLRVRVGRGQQSRGGANVQVGRIRVRAGGLRVRTGKGQNQEGEKKKTGKAGAEKKTLVDLTHQDKLATDQHRTQVYISRGQCGRWVTPGRGWRQSQRQVKQIRV
jgi:hypothetical protein